MTARIQAGKRLPGTKCMPSMPHRRNGWQPRRWPIEGALKAQQKDPVRYGHKYSWLVRLVQRGTSWVAPEDIQRISTSTTDTKVAAQQVQAVAERNQRSKVITADSRYRDQHFLGAFAGLENTFALVRLQNNQKLSQEPVPKPEGSRGAPRKHGADFQLSAIEREPDVLEEFFLGKQKVRLRIWHKLHFKRLANVKGSVVCVEFLKEDGTRATNVRFGYSGLVRKTCPHKTCVACTCGALPLSICSAS